MKCYVLIRVGFDSMENSMGSAINREIVACSLDREKLVPPEERKYHGWDNKTYPQYQIKEAEFIP